jgi:hypothetical protein
MRDNTFRLSLDSTQENMNTDRDDLFLVSHLHRINHRYFLLTLEIPNRDTSTMLLNLDARYGQLEFIGNIPNDTSGFGCSQNGKGFLVHGSHGAVNFLTADNHVLYSLHPLIGERAGQVSWFQSRLDAGY